MVREDIKIGGCEIVVDRFGNGPLIVVLHGEAGPTNITPFLEALGEDYEVVVPHLAGWLDTRRAAHVCTTRDVALVTQEYLELLGGPVTIMGLSFGGWVAAEIASNVPALVSNLVLASPIGVKVGGREDRDFADLYILAARDRDALYYAPGRLPPLSDGGNVDIFLERATADEAIARYCWQPYMHDPSLHGRLRRIQAPTLIISGDHDGFVLNPAYYSEYAKLIPGARHEVIAGAGHRVEEEVPQKVAECVTAFVSANVRNSTAAK